MGVSHDPVVICLRPRASVYNLACAKPILKNNRRTVRSVTYAENASASDGEGEGARCKSEKRDGSVLSNRLQTGKQTTMPEVRLMAGERCLNDPILPRHD